jgi:hypothetical protein
MNLFNFIRFKKRPPVKSPPPTNFVDAFYDPDTGKIKAIDSAGNSVSFNTSDGGNFTVTGNLAVEGTAVFQNAVQLVGGGEVASNAILFNDGNGHDLIIDLPPTMTVSRQLYWGDADGIIPVVPAYADITAANTALASGDYWWDTTLGKLRIATA